MPNFYFLKPRSITAPTPHENNTAKPVGEADWSVVPISQKAVAWGIDMHEGQLLGRPNQIVSTSLACLFMMMTGSGIAMWWKRRPHGSLDWPKRIEPVNLPGVVKAGTLVLGLFMPLFGACVLILCAVERILKHARPAPDP